LSDYNFYTLASVIKVIVYLLYLARVPTGS